MLNFMGGYILVGVVFSFINVIMCMRDPETYNTYTLRDKVFSYIIGVIAHPYYIALIVYAKSKKGR